MRWLLTWALLLFGAGDALAQQTIKITSGEYAPYTSKDLKGGGFINHVISEAFKQEGYPVEFTYLPWKRAYNSAKAGDKFHATSYWYQSADRAEDYLYSDPLLLEYTVFYHLTGNPPGDWKTLDELKDKRIGITDGYTYTKAVWDGKESGRLDIQVVSTDELNFRKLLKGRIDLFLMESVVGAKLLRDKFDPEAAATIRFHPKALMEQPSHLLFSKNRGDAAELRAAFNRGLSKIRANGLYAQMEENLRTGGYD